MVTFQILNRSLIAAIHHMLLNYFNCFLNSSKFPEESSDFIITVTEKNNPFVIPYYLPRAYEIFFFEKILKNR